MELKNKYEINEDIVIIYLTNKKGEIHKTLIDLEDLDKIEKMNLSWHLKWDVGTETYYAKATKYLGIIDGKPKYETIYLHIAIMNFKSNNYKKHVDHINHNTLDNRKENLRIINLDNNIQYRKSRNSNNKSGYRNVSWDKRKEKWIVQLQVNGRNKILGEFKNVHKAGGFATKMREKYYGKFAGNN